MTQESKKTVAKILSSLPEMRYALHSQGMLHGLETLAYQQEHDWKITSNISSTARMVNTRKRNKIVIIIIQLLQSNVNVQFLVYT